jgi:prevent-host-death family protein
MGRPKNGTNVFGAFEAKTNLANLLDRVEKGETIVITRHGQAVAKLVPFEEKIDQKKVDRALAELEKLSKGQSLEGVSIRSLIDEGRRF